MSRRREYDNGSGYSGAQQRGRPIIEEVDDDYQEAPQRYSNRGGAQPVVEEPGDDHYSRRRRDDFSSRRAHFDQDFDFDPFSMHRQRSRRPAHGEMFPFMGGSLFGGDSFFGGGFGFGGSLFEEMDQMMQQARRAGSSGGTSFYSSSTTTRIGANGVSETLHTEEDSSGRKKIAISRGIGDRVHTVEKERDGSGQEHTRKRLNNINEDEEAQFSENWQQMASHHLPNSRFVQNGDHRLGGPQSSRRRIAIEGADDTRNASSRTNNTYDNGSSYSRYRA